MVSVVSRDAWRYAFREKAEYPDATANNGTWLVFPSPEEIDAAWQRVRETVRHDKLGYLAKVATLPSQ